MSAAKHTPGPWVVFVARSRFDLAQFDCHQNVNGCLTSHANLARKYTNQAEAEAARAFWLELGWLASQVLPADSVDTPRPDSIYRSPVSREMLAIAEEMRTHANVIESHDDPGAYARVASLRSWAGRIERAIVNGETMETAMASAIAKATGSAS